MERKCKFCYKIIKNPDKNQSLHEDCKEIYTFEYRLNYVFQFKKRIKKYRRKYFKKKWHNDLEFREKINDRRRWDYRINNGGFYAMPEGIRANLIKQTMEKINA